MVLKQGVPVAFGLECHSEKAEAFFRINICRCLGILQVPLHCKKRLRLDKDGHLDMSDKDARYVPINFQL